MEAKKLEKRIEDWAASLGFKLADGSAPPPNYFSLLTSTPHRRRLWNMLVDSVQSRKTIEHMRKQLLLANLKDTNYGNKLVTTRLDTLKKQNSLERLIKQKRSLVLKLENEILTKASDLLFKICSLSELEKQCDDLKEKTLVLHLFSRQEKKLVEELENCLLTTDRQNGEKNQKCIEVIQAKLNMLSTDFSEECSLDNHDCRITKELEAIRNTGISEQNIWEEVVSCKKSVLEKLDKLLEDFNSNQKTIAREKDIEIQKRFKVLVRQLKQKITEKSLQVILNETEGQLLNMEVQRLENLILETQENSLNESVSGLTLGEMSKTHLSNKEKFSTIKNRVNIAAITAYKTYLEKELLKIVEKYEKNLEKQEKYMQAEFQQSTEIIETTCDEIRDRSVQVEEQSRTILQQHEKLEAVIQKIGNEGRKESFVAGVEKVVANLKASGERQIELFTEIPLDAFRTIDPPIGSKIFECELSSHCFNDNYGGEFKQFFSAMLISPYQPVDAILEEIKKRRKFVEETQKFITEREQLSNSLREIFSRLASVKCNDQLCERNFKDSDKILENILGKADEIDKRIDFTKRGLKNWVEQPYGFMLRETTVGSLGFMAYEENYKKNQKELK